MTGGAGFLGRALVRLLHELGADVRVVHSSNQDLRLPQDAHSAVQGTDIVFHLAARVGGIGFNSRNPATLAHDNVLIDANVFEQSWRVGVEKLVAPCSVCAYPKHTPVPFHEGAIWGGYPEESNAPYGLAKRMLLVLSDSYRRQHGFDSCVPVLTNLYGPGDHFDLEDSHVVPAMVRKFVEGRECQQSEVRLWGTGRPSRELLYVDDAARALVLAAERVGTSTPVNVGTGVPTHIGDLAGMIRRLTGYEGRVAWDASRPDGQPARYLDVTRARDLMGFEAETLLEDGLARTVESFCAPVSEGTAGEAP